jgi:class 3 adenylate cyclase
VSLLDDLNQSAWDIFRSRWNTRDGRVVPDSDDVALGNDGVELDATVLYADIDGSTTMVDTLDPKVAAEVYKAYLICAARIVNAEGGSITAYDGDRIMAVFIGNAKNSAAARTALKINWATQNVVMPAFKRQYTTSSFKLQHHSSFSRRLESTRASFWLRRRAYAVRTISCGSDLLPTTPRR